MPPAIAGPSTAAMSGLVSRRPLSSGSMTDEVERAGPERVARVRGRHGLQVRAGAERAAGAGQDARPDARIVVDLVPGLLHDRHHRPAQRVARVRPVHRDDQHVAPQLDQGVRLLACRGWTAALTWGAGISRSRGHRASLPSHPKGLPRTITRSTFIPMALNIADLFEHAADAVPERLAIACGDAEITYAELEAQSNKLAHYLAAAGVGPGDHVGVYGRNSIELIETILACYKLRAIPVNVNYRYVEAELRYLFTEAELVGLVYDRQFSDKVAALLPDYPSIKAALAIEDGTGVALPAAAVDFADALAAASAVRDFGERSADDIYMLYTGGTTGYPKGVLWRHEDVWRTLGGGIDFTTGERLPDEWEQIRRGTAGPTGLVRLTTAPLIHGSAQWGTLPGLFGGDTVVFVPQFDPHAVWRAVQRHRVNVLMITGDAMARPMIEAYQQEEYDLSSLLAISSNAALFSPVVKEQYLTLLPNIVITDAIGASETGFTGLGYVSAGNKKAEGPDCHRRPVHDRDRRAQQASRARRYRQDRPRRPHPAGLLQGPGQDGGAVRRGRRRPVRRAWRLRQGGGRRLDDAARSRQYLRQYRR